MGGCRALQADTIRGLQIRLAELAAELRQDCQDRREAEAAAEAAGPVCFGERFKDLYRFAFRFGLEEPGQKVRERF